MGTIAIQVVDHDAAVLFREGSVEPAKASEGGRIPVMARARLATERRELGGSAADSEDLVASAGGWDLARIPPTWRALWAEGMTRAELAAGRTAQAEAGGAPPPAGRPTVAPSPTAGVSPRARPRA